MAKKKVIIVGAGVTGLSAGCYALLNGFEVDIYEQHFLPGGLCTSWERGKYVFDGCLSYLYGSGRGQAFSDLWDELGILESLKFIHRDEFIRVRDPDGLDVVAYADPDRLYEHLLSISPTDERPIRRLADGVKHLLRFDLSALQRKPRHLMGPIDWGKLGLEMLPYTGQTLRWATISAAEFAKQFRSPFLRVAIPHLFGWSEIPMLAAVSMLAYLHTGNAGVPEGGSIKLARALESRFTELGGRIFYKKRVERILVENKRAVGVRLYTDEELRADYVISAADGRATLFEMLGGEFASRRHRNIYCDLPDPKRVFEPHSQIQVSYGVKRDLRGEPGWVIHLLPHQPTIAADKREFLSVKNLSYDTTVAPEGHSILEVMIRLRYGYWQRIYGNPLYKTEQTQVAEQVTEQLNWIYPGIAEDIETTDVATPVSYERYTGNWQGSSCGWLLTKRTMLRMMLGMKKTLRRLKGFRMAGQWVEPGGSVPICAASGRNAVWSLCREEGRRFVRRREKRD